MLPQSAFPFLLTSPTNRVGDAFALCEGNLAWGSGRAPALFSYPPPSSTSPQHLDWPWSSASEILGASISNLSAVAPKSVLRSDPLDLLTSRRATAPSLDDQHFFLERDAERAKSAQAQPEEISNGRNPIIKNSPVIPQLTSSSTKKSPDLSHNILRVGDLWTAQSHWIGTLSAIKNPSDLAVQGWARAKNSTSNRCPKPTDTSLGSTRDRPSSDSSNPKLGPVIGSLVDQSASRVRAKQSFDFASVERQIVYFGALDGLDTMASETKLGKNFCAEATPGSSHFGSAMPLSTRQARHITSSISPAKSRTTGNESVSFAVKITTGCGRFLGQLH